MAFLVAKKTIERMLLFFMRRDIFLVSQPVGRYYSLKWDPPPLNGTRPKREPNAGAISFSTREFAGDCYVNSKAVYWGGGDRTLAEEIENQGFDFQDNGFHAAPVDAQGRARVMDYGGGRSYLGYRTFANLNSAIAYLKSVGIIIVNEPNVGA